MVTAAGRIKKLLSQLLFLLDFYITCSSSFVCVCVCVYLCVYLCVRAHPSGNTSSPERPSHPRVVVVREQLNVSL